MTSKGNINSLYQFGSGGSKEPEQLIGAYFQAWLTQDESRLAEFFESDAVYSECYGPEYRGIDQILVGFP